MNVSPAAALLVGTCCPVGNLSGLDLGQLALCIREDLVVKETRHEDVVDRTVLLPVSGISSSDLQFSHIRLERIGNYALVLSQSAFL